MGRRMERELKRLERIHRKRLREQAERIRSCVTRDACERTDCIYFALPEDVAELIEFAEEILAEDLPDVENKSESAFALEKEGTRA